jgi:hypothetical protein
MGSGVLMAGNLEFRPNKLSPSLSPNQMDFDGPSCTLVDFSPKKL